MESRLSILTCAREIAERLEHWGVSSEYLMDWTERITRVVCAPVTSVEGVRVLEDQLSILIRQAFNEVERVAHAVQ